MLPAAVLSSLILLAFLALPGSQATVPCGSICAEGVAIAAPDKELPLFSSTTDNFSAPVPKTCQELDDAFATFNETECVNAFALWQMDYSMWCGCDGHVLDVNNGDCTLCQEGEEFIDRGTEDISSGFPLYEPYPVTCNLVQEVAPMVKFISVCDDFRNNFGTDSCCKAAPQPTNSPTPAPSTSEGVAVAVGPVQLALPVLSFFTVIALC